ncbi:MAG: hypothetical protein DRR19_32045, partial [Candidatus Parabeggiatoa sp. nov. 1]
HIYWFIFHPIFIPNHTQAVGEIWVYIEFIVDSLPTLRIYESLNFNTLGINPQAKSSSPGGLQKSSKKAFLSLLMTS